MSDGTRTGLLVRPGNRPDTANGMASRPGWALAALLGAMFLGNVDVAIANIAGPSIRAGLHASGGELELVVSGFTLAVYLTLAPTPGRAIHGFAALNLMLAATAFAAGCLAVLSIRQGNRTGE